LVEERSLCSEVRPTRTGGAERSDPAGISSEKGSENLPRRKPKDS
jgi:hypothetical protein